MQRVFVQGSNGKALMPCHPARARKLLRSRRAVCVRRVPFTIKLKHREDGEKQPMRLKLDPGSRTTGVALTLEGKRRGQVVVWAAEIHHKGHRVSAGLTDRRMFRHGRRGRKTRYRAPRFNNRSRPKGWIPPSLQSRVDNVMTWVERLINLTPISALDVETVRFDTQKMESPEISGVEYQQGTLAGYETREYLLEKYNRTCVYCDKQDLPLEVDHVVPRSRGGSNRVSNLVIACHDCNSKKGSTPVELFLKGQPERLTRIKRHLKQPLRDAAAVNASRKAIGRALFPFGLPLEFWSGGRTKFNRTRQGYEKTHWLDAACVGTSGEQVSVEGGLNPLFIRATGRGRRRVRRNDKHGFPIGAARTRKRVQGFCTGDLVRLVQPSGRYQGVYVGRLATIRARGSFDIKTNQGARITAPHHRFTQLQGVDGYEYA